MSKKRSKSSGSEIYLIIGIGAVMVVLGLIVLSGGFASPAPSSSALELCNGAPCPAKGDPNAPVVMIEFSDYACSHCRDFNLGTAGVIEQEYVATGKVRYVSHVFALRPDTQPAAAAAMCANDQGKYWEFHKQAFIDQSATAYPARDDFVAWGSAIGLDMNAFTDCVDSGRRNQDAQLSAFEGQQAGVNGTPSFFVDGTLISGNVPLADFRAALDAALAGQ